MKRSLFQSGIFLILIAISITADAAGKPKLTPAMQELQKVLKSEGSAQGRSFDRSEFLKPESRSPGDHHALWWAGYVHSGKEWKPFQETAAVGSDLAVLDEYRQRVNTLPTEPLNQLWLANWCHKNGLLDQERFHLLKFLENPDPQIRQDAVFERLKYKRIGNTWVSPREWNEAVSIQSEIQQSHEKWDAKLEKVAKALKGTANKKAWANGQLSQFAHVSAVPAIVSQLCIQDETLAEFGLQMLGSIPEFEASRAIAGQAVFSPWTPVRLRAMDLLKKRRLDEFAPDLLMLLSNPIRTMASGGIQPSGPANSQTTSVLTVNLDYVWVEETRDTIRVGIRRLFPQLTSSNLVQIDRPKVPKDSGTFDGNNGSRTVGSTEVALVELIEQKQFLDYVAEITNDQRVALNERVGKVLSACTNQPMSAEPKIWWDWWTTYSSVAVMDQKALVVVDERKFQPDQPSFTSTYRYVPSCLIAGTPVWTDRGLTAIEKILPGDSVLSKDIDSGELTYKPVLQTTVRNPTLVQSFNIEGETICASEGHHFWVSGMGWKKMRELVADDPLHTATGMHRIDRVEEDGREEKVYNIVVADFHTYFVGESMILSHDVVTPRLTNVKVPGLRPE